MTIEEAVESVGKAVDDAIDRPMSQEDARECLEQIMSECRTKIDALTSDIGDGDEYPNYKF